MELYKYNEYRLYAYKNIKLPDASSRKYRKICLMACIYACIFRIKIYTMYLWDTFGKCIWRRSIVTHERIKKRIYYYYNTPSLPPPSHPPPPPFQKIFATRLRNDTIGWEHLGKKLWNVSITLEARRRWNNVDENRREISKRFYRFGNEFALCNNVKC